MVTTSQFSCLLSYQHTCTHATAVTDVWLHLNKYTYTAQCGLLQTLGKLHTQAQLHCILIDLRGCALVSGFEQESGKLNSSSSYLLLCKYSQKFLFTYSLAMD